MHVRGFSVQQTIRFVQFGTICTLFFCMGFCFQTVMVHIVPHATDIGVSATAAAIILSVAGVLTIASKLTLGSTIDRIGSKKVAIIVFTLMSVSFLWLLIANDLWMLYLFAIVFGVTWGWFFSDAVTSRS
ncbi:MAG: MFS transporter [Dehalococcoidales bacterium]|nr:MFS transporter [Dehalococcoidales bacterium]